MGPAGKEPYGVLAWKPSRQIDWWYGVVLAVCRIPGKGKSRKTYRANSSLREEPTFRDDANLSEVLPQIWVVTCYQTSFREEGNPLAGSWNVGNLLRLGRLQFSRFPFFFSFLLLPPLLFHFNSASDFMHRLVSNYSYDTWQSAPVCSPKVIVPIAGSLLRVRGKFWWRRRNAIREECSRAMTAPSPKSSPNSHKCIVPNFGRYADVTYSLIYQWQPWQPTPEISRKSA